MKTQSSENGVCVSNIPIFKIWKYFGLLLKLLNDQSGTWCDGSGLWVTQNMAALG